MKENSMLPRATLVTLLVTFVLGLGIGFSAGYFLGSPSGARQQTQAAESGAGTTESVPPGQGASAGQDSGVQPVLIQKEEQSYAAGQHFFIAIEGTTLTPETQAMLRDIQPAGVLLRAENIESPEQAKKLVQDIKDAAGQGSGLSSYPLIAIEQEGGPYNQLQLDDAPSARLIGETGEVEQARQAGLRYAEACKERGIAICFAPVLDIYQEAAHGGLQSRTFGNDRHLVTAMGLAFADGLMEGGVLPIAKHYPGLGAASDDGASPGIAIMDAPVPEVAEIMYPFIEAAARGIPGILAGHIRVPSLAGEVPATLSERLILQVLRDNYGYDGVVIADDLAREGFRDRFPPDIAVLRALQAGNDAVLFLDPEPDAIRSAVKALADASTDNQELQSTLMERRERLQGLQTWLKEPTRLQGPLPTLEGRDVRVAEAEPEAEPETEGPEGEKPEASEATPRDSEEPEDPPAEEPTDREPGEEAAPEDAGTADASSAGESSASTEEAGEQGEAPEPSTPDENAVALTHRIERGEGLSAIARDYGVSMEDIMEWNGLDDANIQFGRSLTIYLPPEKAARFQGEPAEEDEAEPNQDEAEQPPEGTRRVVYTVKPGDILSRLANRYDVPMQDIMEWNDISDPNIRIGQRLVIHTSVEPEEVPEAEAGDQEEEG